jgi:hypothetical protein
MPEGFVCSDTPEIRSPSLTVRADFRNGQGEVL